MPSHSLKFQNPAIHHYSYGNPWISIGSDLQTMDVDLTYHSGEYMGSLSIMHASSIELIYMQIDRSRIFDLIAMACLGKLLIFAGESVNHLYFP